MNRLINFTIENRIKFILFFTLISIIVYFSFYFREVLGTTYPYGDLASDFLLRDTIYHDVLLTGHYSRFGFNHPGSFFFYVDFIFEQIFSLFHLGQYNSFLLSSIILNSFFISIVILLILNLFEVEKRVIYGLFIFLLLFALSYQFLPVDERFHNPSKLILPYMIFVLTTPFIMSRDYRYLPLAFVMMGIVIHGYVVMPLMTIPIILFAFIFSLLLNPRKIDKREFFYIRISILIGILFALPIIIDILIHLGDFQNSNVAKILAIAGGVKDIASWRETLSFLSSYYKNINHFSFLYLLVLGIFSITLHPLGVKKRFFYFFETTLLISTLFLFYYKGAPKPYYEFIGMYYYGVVYSFYIIIIFSIFTLKNRKIRFLREFKFLAFLLLLIAFSQLRYIPSIVPQNLQIKIFVDKIKENSNKNNIIIIDYNDPNDIYLWAQAMGIILELSHQNYNVCTNIFSQALVKPKKICNNNQTYQFLGDICRLENITHINIVNREDCNGSCLSEEFVFGIKNLNAIETNQTIKFNSNKVCFKGFSYPEAKYRWSSQKKALLKFKLNSNRVKGVLKLKFKTLGNQKIVILLNGENIIDKFIDTKREFKTFEIKFNPKILKINKINQLTFYLPYASKFGKDPRDLAIAIKSLRIE